MYKYIGTFLLGAAIGSLITYKLIVIGYEEVIEPTEIKVAPKSNDNSIERLAADLAFYQRNKTQNIKIDSPVISDDMSVEKLAEELSQAFSNKLQAEKKKIEASAKIDEEILKKVEKEFEGGYTEEVKERIDYSAKAKQYVDAAGEVEKEEVEFVSEPTKKERDDTPYVIDIEEFSDGEVTFDKITVYYYEFDNILIEAENEAPEDIDATIGWGSLDEFGNGSVNPDIVYVRNEKLSIDYEVIRLKESYEVSVLGYDK